MSWTKKEEESKELSPARLKTLRNFGFIMTGALGIIGGLLFWKGKDTSFIFLGVASLFLAAALAAPKVLAPIERAWLKFGEKISVVMTFVLVTLIFYLVVTPIGVIMRLCGKDLLGTKLDPEMKSYWVPVEVDGPSSRPFLPY